MSADITTLCGLFTFVQMLLLRVVKQNFVLRIQSNVNAVNIIKLNQNQKSRGQPKNKKLKEKQTKEYLWFGPCFGFLEFFVFLGVVFLKHKATKKHVFGFSKWVGPENQKSHVFQ